MSIGFVSSDPLDNLTNVYQRPIFINSDRAPTSNDLQPPGTQWKYGSTIYETNGAGVWNVNSGTSSLDTINTIAPVNNNFTLAGTANQITLTGGTGTITFSIPSAFIAPGSIASTTSITAGNGFSATLGDIVAAAGNISATLGSVSAATTVTGGTGVTATTGNITASNGNIVFGTAGNKTIYTSVASTTAAGANSAGKVTLVGGTATVSTTAVTSSSIIRLTRQSIGATGAAALGTLTVETIVNGTSFVIAAVNIADATALQASDVSVVGWEIVN